MTPDKIAQAVAGGLSFTCAACANHWKGKDRGLDRCLAAARGVECAGPIAGGVFPEYDGPLKGRFEQFCFVCGMEPDGVVDVFGRGLVGICEEHMEWLESYSKPGERPRFVTKVKVPLLGR